MGKLSPAKIEFEQKLIEHVKLRPAIWKKSHEDHSNSIVVSNMWDSIYDSVKPTDFATNGQGCALIWKNVWDQYLGLKRTVKGKTGKAGGKQRNYRHAQSMKFFDDPVETVTMQSALTNATDSNNEGQFTEGADGSDISGEDSPYTANPQTVTVCIIEELPKPKLEPFAEQLIEVVKGKNLTEYEHFCSAIATKLEKISQINPRAAIQLQTKLQSLVAETEMDVLFHCE